MWKKLLLVAVECSVSNGGTANTILQIVFFTNLSENKNLLNIVTSRNLV